MEFYSYKRGDLLQWTSERAGEPMNKPPQKAKNPHIGHRNRVRESFRQSQGLGMRDSHLLELLLFYSLPRWDTMPLALRLLEAFGDLNGVLIASPEHLMAVHGVSEATASLLRLTGQFLDAWEAECLLPEPLLDTPARQADYIRHAAASNPRRLCLLCLNAECRPLSINGWNPSELADSAIQTILAEASINRASQVVVAFCQEDGPYLPTDEELLTALNCTDALSPFHVELLDALFITREHCLSARRMHLLL